MPCDNKEWSGMSYIVLSVHQSYMCRILFYINTYVSWYEYDLDSNSIRNVVA